MKKLEIKDLSVLTILNEMAIELTNHAINEGFYDGYMHKDISWLLENKNKIVNDFYNNTDKFKGALKTRCKYINMFSKETIYYLVEKL